MRRPRLRQPVLFALLLTNILFTLAAVAPRFADTYWLLELPGHFRAHLSVGTAAVVLVFAALRAWRHVLFGSLTSALVAAPVVALWMPSGLAEQPRTALRALSLNVSFYSRNYDQVLALIEAMRPDVVGLVEINSRWMGRACSAQSTVRAPRRARAPTRLWGGALQPDPFPRRRGAPLPRHRASLRHRDAQHRRGSAGVGCRARGVATWGPVVSGGGAIVNSPPSPTYDANSLTERSCSWEISTPPRGLLRSAVS